MPYNISHKFVIDKILTSNIIKEELIMNASIFREYDIRRIFENVLVKLFK